jgi:predicted glycosyltransferase
LHPVNFTPSRAVVEKYFSTQEPYAILRFAKLKAYHDSGIQGLDDQIAARLIDLLKKRGRVFITSERKLPAQFEQYRIAINPLDIHHVIKFAYLYIGDSQTMATEAAVLGTPFIRFNDFVGRIGTLRELEDHYKLGFGISPKESEQLFAKVEELIRMENLDEIFEARRLLMLKDKIDVSQFFLWFVRNYPESVEMMRENS